MSSRTALVDKGMRLPFVLLILCFAAWGVTASMTDPLVQVFSHIFSMSTLQASLVQFAYYGAYFLLALPAAFINHRFSYKVGVLLGLGLAALGCILFFPASLAMTYGAFLLALFCLAGGFSILETSANPLVFTLGPSGSATRRLNLAQAFNPVGANIGVLISATMILPRLNPATEMERAAMAPADLLRVRHADLTAVMQPYVAFSLVLLVIWLLIALRPMPARHALPVGEGAVGGIAGTARRLMRNRHYVFGVGAQFFNIAGQTCVWTFTIQYAIGAIGVSLAQAAGYLQISLLVFLLARFVMTGLMTMIRPSILLVMMALLGTGLCFGAAGFPSHWGVWAVVSLSACLSLMFPTIYGIALHGLEGDSKIGAAGLVMAIAGGAIMPIFQGMVLDALGAAVSFVVPGLCFLVVAAYAAFDLRSPRDGRGAAL